MEPLVSIIVPIYNTERYLSKCIESICRQTYRHLQIILIDDGSTDGCGAICDEYAARDVRIRVFHRENSGLVATRMFGLSVATGCYVAWVDSDDWIEPETYERMIATAITGDCDMVWCDVMGVHKDKTVLASILYSNAPSEMIRRILKGEVPGWLWNKLIRRTFYDSVNLQLHVDDNMMEDMLQSVELLCANPKMGYISQPMYCYNRTNESAMTAESRTDIAIKGLNNIRHIHDYLTAQGMFNAYRSEFAFLAMKAKLILLQEKGISVAKSFYPYAHEHLSCYRMQPPVSWIYWLGFNGGWLGAKMITLYLRIRQRIKA